MHQAHNALMLSFGFLVVRFHHFGAIQPEFLFDNVTNNITQSLAMPDCLHFGLVSGSFQSLLAQMPTSSKKERMCAFAIWLTIPDAT